MLKNFLASPANRAGLSAWVATVLTAGIQCAVTGHAPPLADLLGVVVGFIAIVQPDNTVTAGELAQVIADMRIAMTATTPQHVVQVVGDVTALAESVAGQTPAH